METAKMETLHDGMIAQHLHELGITWGSITVLQDKDGTTVARVAGDGYSYILKCFQNEAFQREIANYSRLSALGVPTIPVIASTDSAILLEDLHCSPIYRLGTRRDMADVEIARRLARWYKQLHRCGYDDVETHGNGLYDYDESDAFTLENIAIVKERTGTQSAPAWRKIEQYFPEISAALRRVRKTVTYNDFFYTNMAVARDRSSALMFDYNLLGKGYAYADLRNVTTSLPKQSGKAFLEEYGRYDPVEAALDEVVSVVCGLYTACQRKAFPNWANDLLHAVNTTLPQKVEKLRNLL